MNYRNRYSLPILGILCDGRTFYFFEFRRNHREQPRFSLGQFPDGRKGINIQSSNPELVGSEFDCRAAVQQLRNACQALYFVFLKGYKTGLDAYWNRSIEKSKEEGKERDSTPGWHNAMVMAGKALEESVSAWQKYERGEREEAIRLANAGLEFVTARYFIPSFLGVYPR